MLGVRPGDRKTPGLAKPSPGGLFRAWGTARKLSRLLADLLWPEPCAACGIMLGAAPDVFGPKTDFFGPKTVLSGPISALSECLCPECLSLCLAVNEPYCPLCGMPFPPEAASHECSWCRHTPPRYNSARAAALYSGPLRLAVHAYKYGKHAGLAKPLGRALAEAFLAQYGPDSADVAVPVPLHKKRLQYRGFNQALLLLSAFDPARGFPPVAPRALARVRNTQPQVGLSARERTANLKGAFSVTDPALVRGKRVLLVDDVFTTGATAEACSRELFRAGAREVHVLTLARVSW